MSVEYKPFQTDECREYPGILIAVDKDGQGWILNLPDELLVMDMLETTNVEDNLVEGVPKYRGVHEGGLHVQVIPPEDIRIWFDLKRTVWS